MSVLQEDINYIISAAPFLKELKGCTILVTGASGLIGSMIIRTLAQASTELSLDLRAVALVQNANKAKNLFNEHTVELLQGDVREKICFSGKLDHIIHCASVTKSKEMVEKPVETLLTSIEGTKNMLELAREKAVKSMVYISSMEMYGANAQRAGNPQIYIKCGENGLVTEDMLGYLDLSSSRSSYPEGKRTAEYLCYAYHAEYGVPVRVARLAQAFGAGVSKHENRVFAQFARSVMQGTDIILHTDGSSEGNYCYLADAVYGIFTILLKGKHGEAYNVANEKLHMTIRQMAELVAGEVADGKIKVVIDIPKDALEYGYAPSVKLHLGSGKLRALGWNPRYNMKDMYERMIAHWKEEDDQ